jgi:hypothetical protein
MVAGASAWLVSVPGARTSSGFFFISTAGHGFDALGNDEHAAVTAAVAAVAATMAAVAVAAAMAMVTMAVPTAAMATAVARVAHVATAPTTASMTTPPAEIGGSAPPLSAIINTTLYTVHLLQNSKEANPSIISTSLGLESTLSLRVAHKPA